MTGHLFSVRVEFDLDDDPIGGTIINPAGTVEAFHGWMELTERIESARVSALSDAAHPCQ